MDRQTLCVQGRGTATADPDTVWITFSINALEIEYSESIDVLNQRVDYLRQAIQSVGIAPENLKTTRFDISPRHDWNKKADKRIFLGFEAQHNLRLELPMEQDLLNRALMSIAQSESQTTFSISFGIKDQRALQQLVLADAVANARQNAETLAQASGVRLGAILRIEYGWAEVHISERMISYDAAEIASAPAMPDIEPAAIETGDNVTITWAIE